MKYIATVTRSWSDGYIDKAIPAKLAQIAGASRAVRKREMRGFRRRNGTASLERRFARKRRKKR